MNNDHLLSTADYKALTYQKYRKHPLISFVVCGVLAGILSACVKGDAMQESIHESGYVTPLPLRQGGESIDVLVRVTGKKHDHQFHLVFVEKRDWPQEKKDHQRKIFYGFVRVQDQIYPYPVKLRFRLDSADGEGNVHVDKVVAERNREGYGTYYPTGWNDKSDIWRAQMIHKASLNPGVYRVRIDNLNPCPDFDFETLFEFERDNRVY